MLSNLFGTDSFMEMLGTPAFWYTIVILIGIVALLIACIRYWNQGGKWVIVGIFCLGYSALTIYSGINIDAYYSAKGGIYGALTGIFQTNEIEYVNTAEYKISNTELIQVGDTDTYSATIIMDEVFALDKDVDYMVYVNEMPCTYVENARDYVLGDYKYTFYDDNFNAILTDTLNFRFAFYTNSTSLKISTNGGAEALKYWHHYFNKNTFIVKISEVDSLEDFNISIGSGDISNYCTVSYSVDGVITNIQVYQKGQKINLIDIENENYNVWTLNNEIIDNDDIVFESIVLSASFEEIAGLYNNDKMIFSWDELINNDYLSFDNGIVSADTKTKEISGKLIFSETVVAVNDNTFQYCENLTDVVMADSILKIGINSFSHSGLVNIEFSNNLISIRQSAFAQCKNLKEVILPSSLQNMDYNTFSGCSSLERVDVLNGFTTFEGFTFNECIALKYVFIASSVSRITEFEFSHTSHTFVVYCETESIPGGFESGWSASATVKCGYTYDRYLAEIQG